MANLFKNNSLNISNKAFNILNILFFLFLIFVIRVFIKIKLFKYKYFRFIILNSIFYYKFWILKYLKVKNN